MQLFYDNVALHGLGKIELTWQTFDPAPDADAAQRLRVTLRVRLHVLRDDFAANRAAVDQAHEALKKPRAVLRWVNEQNGAVYLNQEVAVDPVNWPDDTKGLMKHQTLDLEFQWYDHGLTLSYTQATWQRTGGPELTLQNVYHVREGYSATRYSPLRSQRSGAAGKLTIGGQFLADPTKPLTNRRAALLATKEQWMTEISDRDGRLVYGEFDRTARVEELTAEVNADFTAMDWTLTVGYSRFPNETTGVLAEYDVQTRDTPQTGQRQVQLSGRIVASSTVTAQAKLDAIRAQVAAGYEDRAMTSGRITATDAQQSADFAGDTTDRHCDVEFEWTYSLQGSRVWVEMQSEATFEAFGPDREQVSGFVAAASIAAVRALYETIRAGYATYLIESERVTEHRVKVKQTTGVPIGSTNTPPKAGSWGTAINTAEVADNTAEPGSGRIVNPPSLGAGYVRQWERLDFTLALHRPKAAAGFLVKMDFSCTYVRRLEGEDALIEVELSDEYEHSGPRLVARPTAFGRDVVQTCGIQSGRRTIRASATAVLESTAVAWVKQQYNLAFSPAIGAAPSTRYRQPPRLSTTPNFALLETSPTARGDTTNVAVWKASLESSEILPNFDFVPPP